MLTIERETCVYSFSKDHEPVAVCHDGDTVLFKTRDCYSDLVKSADYDWEKFLIRVNPVSGPLYIDGAKPGDTLAVRILDIRLDSTGIIVSKPNNGLFGKEINRKVTKIVKLNNGFVEFTDRISLPIEPMIGCIGTAPIAGDIASNTPNNHGGNMDNRRIMIGSVLELPVFTEGALLAMGDLHAVMGDGEVNCSGVECAGQVLVQVQIIKDRRLTNPRVISHGVLYTTASGIDLDMASGIACQEMLNVLMDYNRQDIYDAGMLMSAVGNLEICQVVNPLVTARFGVNLKYIDYDIKEKINAN